MTQKKHRHHDLKDPANKETRWIEKQAEQKTALKTTQKSAKTKDPHNASVLHARKRQERQDRAHEYEPSPTIAALKRVGNKRQRNMRNSKDLFGASEH